MTQIITNNWWGGSWVWVYKYKWSVNSYEDLPSSWMKIWDVYNVVNEHTTAPVFPAWTNVAWTGTDWDALWWSIDLSEYQKKLVEWAWIDIDWDTNEISVESAVINWATAWATAVQPWDDISDLNNDAWYITWIDSSDVTTALWYTPYDSANPSGYITSSSVKNGTLTIQKNWTNVQTFSANQSSNATANISVPTDTSDLTNNAWFITSSAVKDWTLTIQKNWSTIDTFSANSASNVSVNITVPTAVTDLSDASNYQTVWNLVTDLTNPDDTHYPSAKAVSDAITSAWGWDMLKATYDPNNIWKDAFDYDNFINTPTIPAAQIQSDWNEADNTKLDYIKNKPTIPAAQVNSDWNANSWVAQILNKPTIPTVNNPTITIQKNWTKVEDFTLNQSSWETINITVPTKVSDLSNDSWFITWITSGDVTTALGYTPYNSSNPDWYISWITSWDVTTALWYTPVNPSSLGTAASKDTWTSSWNVPVLDSNGKLNTSTLPWVALTDTFTVSTSSDLTSLSSAEQWDLAIVTTENKTYVLSADPYSTAANWKEILAPTGWVTSVNSQTWAVTLDADDISDSTTTNKFVTASDKTTWSGKQDALVSWTNIKTINWNSILGSWNITVSSSTTTTCTLTSAWWSSNSQTVSVTGVTASNTVIVSPAPSDIADYADCGVYCSAQGSGTLTFGCDTAPSGDIVVNVLIMS